MKKPEMLHIFRNTPLGRETLMMSAFFSKRCRLRLRVYIPRHDQFLMYFDESIATIELDRTFLHAPDTARAHAEEVLVSSRVDYDYIEPPRFTTQRLPDLPTDFDFMCCPRSISDVSTRISLGHIGPAVRKIIRNARFPVLLPSAVARGWKAVVCFFDGSPREVQALRCAADLADRSRSPLVLFTHAPGRSRSDLERRIPDDELRRAVHDARWILCHLKSFEEGLYEVPHDALVVIGAGGRGLAKELLFGSRLEVVQSVLPNQLLVVGPRFEPARARDVSAPQAQRRPGGVARGGGER
jgi:hypothetical protein